MRLKIVYPKWRKLEGQTPFTLPPHGPIVFAASLPPDVDVEFIDENVQEPDLESPCDVVAVSAMLTAQLPRAVEIADECRRRGVPVIAGGISITLHSDELVGRFDAVFRGESEGRIAAVLDDLRNGELKPLYDHLATPPPIESVGIARRDLLHPTGYIYRGTRMLDLVHASRGCRFDCFPCCTGMLGGRNFRPRPIEQVVAEVESIENNRLFFVDNSFAQDKGWIRELFQALIPLKRKWVCHPIEEDDEILDLAYKAGCWYVYQAVFDTSDFIRRRIAAYKDHGIGVEGTIILGMDDHTVASIRRLVDFLVEVELDLAEFTILTPFQGSPIRTQLFNQGRLLTDEWVEYTGDRVVYQPKGMTPAELQDVYYEAWDTFHAHKSRELRMGKLFLQLARREKADGLGWSAA
jgi:radical SAM superfamily enzyme YgiQ (UPF0313 family)